MRIYKLAFLTSHVIPYQTPFFRKLAEHPKIDLTVYFCNTQGLKESFDPEFGKKIKWDIPLLEGYKYKFLKNWSFGKKFVLLDRVNPGIIWELKKNKPDAIIVNSWTGLTDWFVFLAENTIFLRSESPLKQELLKRAWKIKIREIVLRLLRKKIKAFLYIGEENKKFYQFYGIPDEKLFFVPYAVDNERFTKEFAQLKNKKDELKQKMGIDLQKVVILYVGKLIKKKRPFDLLLAYERLNYKNKALIYVGDGLMMGELRDYINNKKLKDVYLVGFKNQTELASYYTIGDIFVLPSGTGETWGLVVNEAMCFKLPIIVSDLVGCARDLVKSGENGYVFPCGNVDKLKKHLEELVQNKEKRRSFGEKSFEIIQSYGYEKDVEGILQAIENNLKNKT